MREARNGGPKLKSVEEFNRQRAGEPAEGAADETPLALRTASNDSSDVEFRWCLRLVETVSGKDDR